MFLPSDPANTVTVVKLTDLLPDFRAAIEETRTTNGWDGQKLQQVVAHDFEFLGPFVTARIERTTIEGGEQIEFLIVEFRPPEGRDLDRAEQLFHNATQRAQRGDVRGAIPDLKRVVGQFPEMPKYHQALGQAYMETGKPDEAEDELLRALQLDPRLEDALTLLANLYAKQGKIEMAIPLYRRSIALRPTVYSLSNLAGIIAKTGQAEEAVTLFEAAVREDASYPNAWYGLGMALFVTGNAARRADALGAFDHALQAIGERCKNPELWDATREGLHRVVYAFAQVAIPKAEAINAEVADTEGQRSGLPVRREEATLTGVSAKLEYGWVHHRPYHRLLVQPNAGIEREHYVRHELEHLRLVNLARAAGRNRWFVTTEQNTQTMTAAIQRDLDRLRKQGWPPEQTETYIQQITSGILTQLYNAPVDLLIEFRILDADPLFEPLVYLSIKHQLEQGLQGAEDADIRRTAPRAIFRANVAMNGASAIWFENRWPMRTDILARYQRTEAWPLAQRLFASWDASAAQWTTGAEYGWIDEWANILGLTGWHGWIDGNPKPTSAPTQAMAPTTMPEAERMAYLHFMLGALEWLDREGLTRGGEVAAEIASLGMTGLDLGGTRQYTLRAVPGKEFSGRHLVSYLYVCLKAIDPTIDPGIDLHEPYLQALELHQTQRPKGE